MSQHPIITDTYFKWEFIYENIQAWQLAYWDRMHPGKRKALKKIREIPGARRDKSSRETGPAPSRPTSPLVMALHIF